MYSPDHPVPVQQRRWVNVKHTTSNGLYFFQHPQEKKRSTSTLRTIFLFLLPALDPVRRNSYPSLRAAQELHWHSSALAQVLTLVELQQLLQALGSCCPTAITLGLECQGRQKCFCRLGPISLYKTAPAAEPSQQQHLIYPLHNRLPQSCLHSLEVLFIDNQCCPTGVIQFLCVTVQRQLELGKSNTGEMVPAPSSP